MVGSIRTSYCKDRSQAASTLMLNNVDVAVGKLENVDFRIVVAFFCAGLKLVSITYVSRGLA